MRRVLLFLTLFFCATALYGQSPRYLFYFIGDGMGFEHLKLTGEKLSFVDFEVKGALITGSLSDTVTDSAAAGTALACGNKSTNGTLGMSGDHQVALQSVAVLAKQMGRAVGILTTVSLDHATPAAFYAHVPSRTMSYQIAIQLPASGFDLFAGAGLLDVRDGWEVFADSCYSVVRGSDAKLEGKKTVWIEREGAKVEQFTKAIEREGGEMTLGGVVDRSIDYLTGLGGENGFLLIAEGGQIDWASHNNDTKYAVEEVDDFSRSVAVAIEFYKRHPDQTLIIVTADHETGGLYFDAQGEARWTTGHHTKANVPLFAIGVGAERFAHVMENNVVALIIKELIAGR